MSLKENLIGAAVVLVLVLFAAAAIIATIGLAT